MLLRTATLERIRCQPAQGFPGHPLASWLMPDASVSGRVGGFSVRPSTAPRSILAALARQQWACADQQDWPVIAPKILSSNATRLFAPARPPRIPAARSDAARPTSPTLTPKQIPKRPLHCRCPTSRDFLPWRWTPVSERVRRMVCRHPKTPGTQQKSRTQAALRKSAHRAVRVRLCLMDHPALSRFSCKTAFKQ